MKSMIVDIRLLSPSAEARVAVLQPVKKKPWKSPEGAWIGKVEIVGDIVGFDTAPFWDALREDYEILP
jgi:hypothetical protein